MQFATLFSALKVFNVLSVLNALGVLIVLIVPKVPNDILVPRQSAHVIQ